MIPAYVVLAAGAARRMGFDKITTPLRGRSPLERIVAALGDRRTIVVTPGRLAEAVARVAPSAVIAVNDEPERGMAHSLRAGLAHVAADCAFGVLLGDMAAMSAITIARTESLFDDGIDVAYPVGADGRPGHPVLFSARARTLVESLPDGDRLQRARLDAALTRATWVCSDRSAFADLDAPPDWQAF